MNKLVIVMSLLASSVGFSATTSDMKNAPVCVFEQFKAAPGDHNVPEYVVSCGEDVILQQATIPYAQIQDKKAYQDAEQQIMVQMMGGVGSVNCTQADSESVFLIICKR